MSYHDFYQQTEKRVCRLLYTLPEGHSLTRLAIGRELFAKTGSTILASVIGTLRGKGYVEARLPAFDEKGARYRLTERGRLAVELLDAIEEHEAEAS